MGVGSFRFVTGSVVCVDVNPGGAKRWVGRGGIERRTVTQGHFGVAELVGDELGAEFELAYRHPAEDPGEFRLAWAFLESFVSGRPVVAYNAAYDVGALARMLVLAGLVPAPEFGLVCAWAMRKALLPRGVNDRLWTTMLGLGLVSQQEERQLPRTSAGTHTCLADARACALLVVHMAEVVGVSPGELVARESAHRLVDAAAFRPITSLG